MDKKYTIAVAGTGYVGLSIATLLSQHHKVYAVDIVPAKVDMVNQRKSPIQDEYIEKYLAEKDLDLTATLDAEMAYSAADFVVIAAPTNYDSSTQHFDTSAVENVIDLVMKYNPEAVMIIKSTIPIGYTKSIRERTRNKNILFSTVFLREAKALYNNRHAADYRFYFCHQSLWSLLQTGDSGDVGAGNSSDVRRTAGMEKCDQKTSADRRGSAAYAGDR